MRPNNLKILKKMNFFKNFNWDDLLDFKIKAPYIPEQKNMNPNILKSRQPFEQMLKAYNPSASEKENLSMSYDDIQEEDVMNVENKWAEDF